MSGERFRVARARKGATMRDIARICDCSATAVLKWEQGKMLPRSGKLLRFCEAMDVSVEWLLDPEPLDFKSTETAPQGRHAKYWVRAALDELADLGAVMIVRGKE